MSNFTSGFVFCSLVIFLLQPVVPGRCSGIPGENNQEGGKNSSFYQRCLDKLSSAWNEAIHISPLACVLIMLPVTLCFLLCICCICCCVKCNNSAGSKKSNVRERDRANSSSSSRMALKSPPGEPSPIPLMGLANNGSQNGFHHLRPVPGQGHSVWTAA